MNIQTAKRKFLEHLEIALGRSLKTIENYDRYLKRFFKEMNIQDFSDITDESIQQFRLHLNRSGLSLKTQNYHLIAIRSYITYVNDCDVETPISPTSIRLAKVTMRDLDLITPAEFERLREAADGEKIEDKRNKAIIETLFSTGLRVSELIALPRDLDLTVDEAVIRGKGGKIRVVFFSPTAKKAIKTYLRMRKDMSSALFSGQQATPITARTVERIVLACAKKAGIAKKVTPHIIRHVFATTLLSNGADLRSVQEMLGHANIATTQVYTHVTNKQLRDIHKKYLH